MPAHKKTPASMMACPGEGCGGCSSSNCYAKGGSVNDDAFEPRETLPASHPEKHQKGVHESSRFGSKGVSMAGEDQRTGLDSKEDHRRVLGELKVMKKPHLYAEGGSVDSWTKREDNEKGVHGPTGKSEFGRGESMAGKHARAMKDDPENSGSHQHRAKVYHNKALGEMRGMSKPKLYADGGQVQKPASSGNDYQVGEEGSPGQQITQTMQGWFGGTADNKAHGGEIDAPDEGMDDELKHAMGGELMGALERKDRKGIMSALEAIVLSCRGKE